MDRLKFRAWCPSNKKMVLNIQDTDDFRLFFQRRFKVMQSTGLEDKNDTLIYEKDIMYSEYFKEYGYVIYINGIYWLKFKNGAEELFKSYKDEVVGNFFENPELLKEIDT